MSPTLLHAMLLFGHCCSQLGSPYVTLVVVLPSGYVKNSMERRRRRRARSCSMKARSSAFTASTTLLESASGLATGSVRDLEPSGRSGTGRSGTCRSEASTMGSVSSGSDAAGRLREARVAIFKSVGGLKVLFSLRLGSKVFPRVLALAFRGSYGCCWRWLGLLH